MNERLIGLFLLLVILLYSMVNTVLKIVYVVYLVVSCDIIPKVASGQ